MPRAQLLINPGAWQTGAPASEGEMRRQLGEAGYQLDIEQIADSGNGAALASAAVRAGYDLVIAGGGDGTIQQVAAGMIHSKVPLAILPLGTMNNIARSLCIPLDLKDALAVIAAGQQRRIDMGIANGTPFVEVVNVGAEAAFSPVGEAARHHGFWSALHGMVAGLRLLFRLQRHGLTIEIDGKRHHVHAWEITICNAPLYGLHFAAAPDARLDDGMLDVVISRQTQRWRYLLNYWALMEGRRVPDVNVQRYPARQIRIYGRDRVPITVAGYTAGYTPLFVTVAPGALTVIAPPAPDQPLSAEPPIAAILHSLG